MCAKCNIALVGDFEEKGALLMRQRPLLMGQVQTNRHFLTKIVQFQQKRSRKSHISFVLGGYVEESECVLYQIKKTKKHGGCRNEGNIVRGQQGLT
jgi:hypothetical protein